MSRTSRAWRLYAIGLKSVLHRVRADLGGELVVFISSAVLFATFLYVFNDFLNVQIASLSALMRTRFAEIGAAVVLALATIASGRTLRREYFDAQTLTRTAAALGEEKSTQLLYRSLYTATTVAFFHGLAWVFTKRYLISWEIAPSIIVESLMLIASLILAHIPPRSDAPSSPSSPPKYLDRTANAGGRAQVLLTWRLRQIIRRNRSTQACLVLAALFWLAIALAAAARMPAFVASLAALAGGYFAAATQSFQLREDLTHAWTERALGITHADIVKTYTRIGLVIGAAFSLPAGLIYFGVNAAVQVPSFASLNDAAKVIALGILPGLLSPYICFQIDARRPAIGLMASLIASLFLGTALYAHWLSLALLLILKPYARQMQDGRFYRA